MQNGQPLEHGIKLVLGRRNMLSWEQVFAQIEQRASFPADAVSKVRQAKSTCLAKADQEATLLPAFTLSLVHLQSIRFASPTAPK